MGKRAVLLLIAVLALSSFAVFSAPASAQLVPDFTLKLAAFPYDVPTTYGIDPYTGKNVTIQEGYHVENKSVEITIRNQVASGLFYNVRYKGHFGESWTQLYSYSEYSTDSLRPKSNSAYTVISIPAFSPGTKVDFQVEALLWHNVDVWVSDHPMAPPPISEIGHYEQRLTLYARSGWSPAQTLTFPAILPNVTLLGVQEEEFDTTSFLLNFAVDKAISEINYSLDGQKNVTIAGNTTLTGLANGRHNVTVYTTDEEGNTGASEPLFFGVEVPEPFPVVPLVAVSVVVVAAIAGLLLYRRKHRRETAQM